MNRQADDVLSGIRANWLRICLQWAAILGLVWCGVIWAGPTMQVDLKSIDVEQYMPSPAEFPRDGGLEWQGLRGDLPNNRINEVNRSVTTGLNYFGYTRFRDLLGEEEERLAQVQRDAEAAPQRYAEQLARCRNKIAEAQARLEKGRLNDTQREHYQKQLESEQKSLESLIAGKEEFLASSRAPFEYSQERLARFRGMSAQEMAEQNLVYSACVSVIAGITYLEDTAEWLAAIKQHDPLFADGPSAEVGEASVLSPKIMDSVYNVRFYRGTYAVSLWIKGGGMEPLPKGLKTQVVGKTIAELFDRKLKGGVQGISVELNQMTGAPYDGLVADGETTLEIAIILPNVSMVTVELPSSGQLLSRGDDDEQPLTSGDLALSSGGRATLFYRPPPYLQEEELTEQMSFAGDTGNQGSATVWYAPVRLVFTWTDEHGQDQQKEIQIRVVRPQVFLVHGFTGDLSTWAHLDRELVSHKWQTYRDEYYQGQTGIPELAQLLRSYLEKQRRVYEQSGLKVRKVDIVAHSMGGLISRHYISVSDTYDHDVRKLIMVATPNHGSTWFDGQIGELASLKDGLAHWQENKDLRNNSEFMQKLNAGEEKGQHLNKEVQYALLYGRRNGYRVLKTSMITGAMMADDGVVSVESALLNCVVSYRFDGCIHSGAIKDIYQADTSITEDGSVWQKIQTCLLEELPRAHEQASQALVTEVHGRVTRRGGRGHAIQTGEDVNRYVVWTGPESGFGAELISGAETWGRISVYENSKVLFASVAHGIARFFIENGQADFWFAPRKDSFCQIAVGDDQGPEGVRPLLNIYHLKTDFSLTWAENMADIVSREGALQLEYLTSDGQTTREIVPSGETRTIDLTAARNLPSRKGPALDPTPVVTYEVAPSDELPGGEDTRMIITLADTTKSDPVGRFTGNVFLKEVIFLKDNALVSVVYKNLPEGALLAVEIDAGGAAPRRASTVTAGSGTWDFRVTAPLMGWPEIKHLVRIKLNDIIILEETISREGKQHDHNTQK
ncbi:hypothetical protein JXQ70_09275 [bacterium]|nr:hypothetical protein [bacterium]